RLASKPRVSLRSPGANVLAALPGCLFARRRRARRLKRRPIQFPGYETSMRLYVLALPPGQNTPAPPKRFGLIVASRRNDSASSVLVASTVNLLPTILSVIVVFGFNTPLNT